MEQTTLYDVVMNLYRQRKFAELKTVMGQLNPADVANIIENADGRDVIALFGSCQKNSRPKPLLISTRNSRSSSFWRLPTASSAKL